MSGRMMRSDVDLEHWLSRGVAAIDEWQGSFSPFEQHPSLRVSDEQFASAFAALTQRLGDNYPFFHPSYAGQMLKPPHPVALAAYLTAARVNPNNHALDGGPATAALGGRSGCAAAQMFASGIWATSQARARVRESRGALGGAWRLQPGKRGSRFRRGVALHAQAGCAELLGIEGTTVVPVDRREASSM